MIDIRAYNRLAWDHQVKHGNPWTIPVSPEQIALARQGDWSLLLTPTKPVPRDWYPADLHGVKTLCLASGGGQQGPILAAAGAQVTVFDNSPAQLGQDRLVAERDDLDIQTVEGDMADLSVFPDQSFELIFHPVSNLFVPRLQPVWNEAFRVLKPGGILLAGFMNPVGNLFDFDLMENERKFVVCHRIPYSDVDQLPPDQLQKFIDEGAPLEYGHTLEDQIGGQIKAGFAITGFYEDIEPRLILSEYIPSYIATRGVKIR